MGVELKLMCGAHHEAGHMTVAAVQGLRVRPEGLSLDPRGAGLACYCKRPGESVPSRERVVIATFAGFKAQEHFCEEMSCTMPDPIGIILSPDWREAREIIIDLADLLNEGVASIQQRLENRSKRLIEQNWPAVKALAAALLAKKWEPLRPLKSGILWSDETTAKHVTGEEAATILERQGIAAVCDSAC